MKLELLKLEMLCDSWGLSTAISLWWSRLGVGCFYAPISVVCRLINLKFMLLVFLKSNEPIFMHFFSISIQEIYPRMQLIIIAII